MLLDSIANFERLSTTEEEPDNNCKSRLIFLPFKIIKKSFLSGLYKISNYLHPVLGVYYSNLKDAKNRLLQFNPLGTGIINLPEKIPRVPFFLSRLPFTQNYTNFIQKNLKGRSQKLVSESFILFRNFEYEDRLHFSRARLSFLRPFY